ncbi:flavodoxin family protein [Roseivirga sp.]|uniref:flavodoxin family protein n=1 Tax=Roseivirga sp. TaxID=1964215 RepID=UPI003B526F7F
MVRDTKNTLVILGSARGDGDTFDLVNTLLKDIDFKLVNLLDWRVEEYNYDEEYSEEDQFPEIIEQMKEADLIIFATPVYWYSMSAQLKVFFDRMTNLTDLYKSTGKALKGKSTALISTGSSEEVPEGFYVPFRDTSHYFGMEFKRGYYQSSKANHFPKADQSFIDIL